MMIATLSPSSRNCIIYNFPFPSLSFLGCFRSILLFFLQLLYDTILFLYVFFLALFITSFLFMTINVCDALVQCCLLSKFHCTLSIYFLYHSFFAMFVGSLHFVSTIWWHSNVQVKLFEFSKIYCILTIMLLL